MAIKVRGHADFCRHRGAKVVHRQTKLGSTQLFPGASVQLTNPAWPQSTGTKLGRHARGGMRLGYHVGAALSHAFTYRTN